MEKNFNAKKTVNLVVNVILWIFVAFCVFVTIVAVSANANAKNVPTVGGKCYLYISAIASLYLITVFKTFALSALSL